MSSVNIDICFDCLRSMMETEKKLRWNQLEFVNVSDVRCLFPMRFGSALIEFITKTAGFFFYSTCFLSANNLCCVCVCVILCMQFWFYWRRKKKIKEKSFKCVNYNLRKDVSDRKGERGKNKKKRNKNIAVQMQFDWQLWFGSVSFWKYSNRESMHLLRLW